MEVCPHNNCSYLGVSVLCLEKKMTHFLLKIRIPWFLFLENSFAADGVSNDSALLVSYSEQFNKPFLRACQVPWLWASDRLGFEFQLYHAGILPRGAQFLVYDVRMNTSVTGLLKDGVCKALDMVSGR